jgi:hypothetical protein
LIDIGICMTTFVDARWVIAVPSVAASCAVTPSTGPVSSKKEHATCSSRENKSPDLCGAIKILRIGCAANTERRMVDIVINDRHSRDGIFYPSISWIKNGGGGAERCAADDGKATVACEGRAAE